MNGYKIGLLTLGLFALVNTSPAAIRYVDLNNTTPSTPHTSWASAATNIQQAIDAAVPGDLILVTNGVYETGSSLWNGANRVSVFKPVTVQSVNGPLSTAIRGYQVPGTTNGTGAIRGVYLVQGATLVVDGGEGITG